MTRYSELKRQLDELRDGAPNAAEFAQGLARTQDELKRAIEERRDPDELAELEGRLSGYRALLQDAQREQARRRLLGDDLRYQLNDLLRQVEIIDGQIEAKETHLSGEPFEAKRRELRGRLQLVDVQEKSYREGLEELRELRASLLAPDLSPHWPGLLAHQ